MGESCPRATLSVSRGGRFEPNGVNRRDLRVHRASGRRAGGAGGAEGRPDHENPGARHATMPPRPCTRWPRMTAERMLAAGGNAFDAIVAGQAVLGLAQPSLNGVGSDATLLIYDAKAKKVFSLNAEGTAPKLATIEWYKTHQGGKIPVDDSLLSATVPGVVDAWYILLSRWGTRKFADVLAPAIELAERGIPHGHDAECSQALRKYPTSVRAVRAARRHGSGATARSGRTPTWPAPCAGWWKPRSRRPPRAARPGSRPRATASTRATSRARWPSSREENGGLFRYEDFANYTAKVEEPVSIDYRGYTIYKNASSTPRPRRVVRAQHSGRLRPEEDGPEFAGLHPHLGRSHQTGHGGSRYLPRRHGFHPDSVPRAALEGLRRRAAQA